MRYDDEPDRAKPTRAVIYARVSSAAQIKRGDGLASQETRCREFARSRGYEIVETFTDDLSGSAIDRPGMKAMLSFLRKHRADPHVVLIDDISRLARGVKAHMELRAAISVAGGLLESPTVEFGEDADSELREYILATVAQHQRRKNAEQTINRMRARVMNGYWPFSCPIGYRVEKSAGHGKVLTRNEPHASILQEALEGFASGRFETQVEVKRFLESQPEFPKDLPNGEIRNQRITDFLTRPIYAGYVQAPNWDVSLRKGQHEGLIDLVTFERIQARLTEKAKVPARKDINADFPLRGFVVCGDCDKPLTACWSKSSTGKKHPYYLCFTKGCDSYRKSIPRQKMEGEFAAIVQSMQPSRDLFNVAYAMFKEAWTRWSEAAAQSKAAIRSEIKSIDKQIENLVDRIVDADSQSVISAYEKKIAKLERNKLLATEKLAETTAPRRTFDELFELAFAFLANPWNLWQTGELDLRRTVLKLGFCERISYHRNEGFSNAKTSLPFNMLREMTMPEKAMAHPGRFELPTPRFVVWCSIQLSYGCVARSALGPGKAA